ncbi:hypothetical protein Droror1_Dr00012296 [Drosera rotundifolia]
MDKEENYNKANGNEEHEVDDLKNNDEKEEVKYMGIWAMPFIIGNETFEKLGALGTLSNLLIYLTTVFNMKTITATTIINVFNGTTNLGTLIGAYLCDTYFGRFKTLGFATTTSFFGLSVIALTAVVKQLHPPHCRANDATCIGPTGWQMAFLLLGFVLMIIGASGIRPCNMTFGADQFNPNTESGKRGIASFFNWYFFTYTFAMMISVTLIVYIQSNISWSIGLGIPAGLMLLACVLYFAGNNIYVKVKTKGSPVTSVIQVLVVAVKKRQLVLPEQSVVSLLDYVPPDTINSKLPRTEKFRFFDKAAIITSKDKTNPDGSPSDPWNLCSIQQVEELKCLLRVIPVWASAFLYYNAIAQQQTYAIFQAVQSDRHLTSHFQIPAASYIVFQMLGLSIWLPIYDRVVVPFLQKVTKKKGGITVLQRMGIGIVLSILTSIVSAVVEQKRRHLALTGSIEGMTPKNGAISSLSASWLIPQLVLAGLAEAFMAVGQIEFYYKQFPENMRCIGASLFYCGMAIGSYISSFLVSVIHQATEKHGRGGWLAEDLNKGNLDYFYYVVAALGTMDFIYFLIVAGWYKYKGTGDHDDSGDVDNIQTIEFVEAEKAIV